MATSSLSNLLNMPDGSSSSEMGFSQMNPSVGGNVQAGVGQVQQGASVIGNALDSINSAVGDVSSMKKGGSVKKTKISTHQKSKKSPNW